MRALRPAATRVDLSYLAGPTPSLACDTHVREGLKLASVTKLSLKLAQTGQKQSKAIKQELSLSYSWQRDLVEFSIS
jgi:hypothetical protein